MDWAVKPTPAEVRQALGYVTKIAWHIVKLNKVCALIILLSTDLKLRLAYYLGAVFRL